MSLISVIRSQRGIFLQMIGNYFFLRLSKTASKWNNKKKVLGLDRISKAGGLEVTVSDFQGVIDRLSSLGLRRTGEDRQGLQAYCCHGDRREAGLFHQSCHLLRRRMTRTANRCESCRTCHSVAAPPPCGGWSCCPRPQGACSGCPWALCDMRGREEPPDLPPSRTDFGDVPATFCSRRCQLPGVPPCWCPGVSRHGKHQRKLWSAERECNHTECVTVSLTPMSALRGAGWRGVNKAAAKPPQPPSSLCPCLGLAAAVCLPVHTEPNGCLCWVSRSLLGLAVCASLTPHQELRSLAPAHSL